MPDNPAIPAATIEEIKYLWESCQTERACDLCQYISDLFPKNALAHYYLAVELLSLDRLEESLQHFEAALTYYEPKKGIAIRSLWSRTGEVLNKLNRSKEAIPYLDKAINITRRNNLPHDPHLEKALALLNTGEAYEEALTLVDHSIKTRPPIALALNTKGCILRKLQRFRQAIAAYDKAIELDDEDIVLYNNKSLALIELEEYEKAIEVIDSAIPKKIPNAVSYYLRGFAEFKMGNFDVAMENYNLSLSIDPNDKRTIARKKELLQAMEETHEPPKKKRKT